MAIEQEWWKDKLAEDIYTNLKLKELAMPTACHAAHGGPQSPHLRLRRHLVDWLALVVGELGVCATSHHLAVHLLDRVMDTVPIERGYLHLLALCCLLVAVKFEDHSDRVPSYCKLSGYLPATPQRGPGDGRTSYTARQYLDMELKLLRVVDFQLCVPTVAHFLPYFLQVAVDEDDLRDGLPISSKPLVETYLAKHALYFQEVCLQEHVFREYAASLVAASCVASARICLHLTPTWPKQLELMTDLYLEQLLPCLHVMLGKHHQDSVTSGLASSYAIDQSVNYLPSSNTPAPPQSYLPSDTPTAAVAGYVQTGHPTTQYQSKYTAGANQPYYTPDNSAYVYNNGLNGIGVTNLCRGIRGS